MKTKLFAVHDVAAGAYLQPHSFPTVAVAIRSFGQGCSDPNSGFHVHPHDFSLHCIGEFDELTGFITPCEPVCVSKALDFMESPLKAVSDA